MESEVRASQLYRLVEGRLDGTLPDYVQKALSSSMSWRTMAADLHERTGIKVSHETLRSWFGHRIQVQVEVKVA